MHVCILDPMPNFNTLTTHDPSSDEFAYRKTNRARALPPHAVSGKRQNAARNDGPSSSQLAQLSEQGASITVSHSALDADKQENDLYPEDGGAGLLRPGLPRQWSGFSNSSEFESPVEENPAPSLPADVPWAEQQSSVYEQSSNDVVVNAERITSSTAFQDNPESGILDHTMADYLYGSPDDSSKDALSASLLDDYNRMIASDPVSNTASTPKSLSSRGRSRGTSHSQHSSRSDFRIPDLKPAFFESDFYRRFHIQSACMAVTLCSRAALRFLTLLIRTNSRSNRSQEEIHLERSVLGSEYGSYWSHSVPCAIRMGMFVRHRRIRRADHYARGVASPTNSRRICSAGASTGRARNG